MKENLSFLFCRRILHIYRQMHLMVKLNNLEVCRSFHSELIIPLYRRHEKWVRKASSAMRVCLYDMSKVKYIASFLVTGKISFNNGLPMKSCKLSTRLRFPNIVRLGCLWLKLQNSNIALSIVSRPLDWNVRNASL